MKAWTVRSRATGVIARLGLLLAIIALCGASACGTGAAPAPGTAAPGTGTAAPGSGTRGTGSARPSTPPPTATPGPAGRVRPDHVVVVVLENKATGQISGSTAAPYLNALMADSAVFTNARAVAHPSQPNYLALFSGSTHNVTDDRCPLRLGDRPNLGRQLLDAGLSFVGYSEGLPGVGFTGCSSGRYAAKHNPWVHFSNLPAAVNQPATAFPSDYAQLPTVAFLIPDLCHDMHDCPISTGDSWLREHVDPYARWAREHNSLLVVTFDENDNTAGNRILTLVSGAGVRPGRYGQPVDHYTMLSTVDELFGLARLGAAAAAPPVTGVWR